jgi:hypothetical protein
MRLIVWYVIKHEKNFALYWLTFYMLSLIKQGALFSLSKESAGGKPRTVLVIERSRERAA